MTSAVRASFQPRNPKAKETSPAAKTCIRRRFLEYERGIRSSVSQVGHGNGCLKFTCLYSIGDPQLGQMGKSDRMTQLTPRTGALVVDSFRYAATFDFE